MNEHRTDPVRSPLCSRPWTGRSVASGSRRRLLAFSDQLEACESNGTDGIDQDLGWSRTDMHHTAARTLQVLA